MIRIKGWHTCGDHNQGLFIAHRSVHCWLDTLCGCGCLCVHRVVLVVMITVLSEGMTLIITVLVYIEVKSASIMPTLPRRYHHLATLSTP